MDSDTADTCCTVALTCSQSLAVSKAIQQRYSDTAINPDTSYLMYRQGSEQQAIPDDDGDDGGDDVDF